MKLFVNSYLKITFLLFLINLSLLASTKKKIKKPNIIFILADDLGYGEVGVYGQKKMLTPQLDKMASEGMKFTHHFSGAPVCAPSRATLMTGQSQAIGFVKGNPGSNIERENLRKEDIIIPEILKEVGYHTACIGKWALGRKGFSGYPLNKGFDYFLGYSTHKAAHNYYPKSLDYNKGVMKLKKNKKNKKRTYSHDVFTEKAISFVKKNTINLTFFI